MKYLGRIINLILEVFIALRLIKIIVVNIIHLLKADSIVYMYKLGFGHTLIGPDVQRRLMKDLKCVFLIILVCFSLWGGCQVVQNYIADFFALRITENDGVFDGFELEQL